MSFNEYGCHVGSIEQGYNRMVRDISGMGYRTEPIENDKSIGSNFGKGNRGYTRELMNYSAIFDNPLDRLIWSKERRVDLLYNIAQFFWIMSGSNQVKEISWANSRAAQMSDDGATINGAYGARILGEGSDNILHCLRVLSEDPTSRRAYIPIFCPRDTSANSRDIPCTTGIHYFIRAGKLHSICNMRSQSLIFVFPYDSFFFSLLHELMSVWTARESGMYFHNANSLHYYEIEEPMAVKLLTEESKHKILESKVAQPTMWKIESDVSYPFFQMVILDVYKKILFTLIMAQENESAPTSVIEEEVVNQILRTTLNNNRFFASLLASMSYLKLLKHKREPRIVQEYIDPTLLTYIKEVNINV